MSIRSLSLTTAIFGAAWGFVDWGISGTIFAWLYNLIDRKN